MSKNLVETIKQEQNYKILIRNLRKQQEEKDNEKANDKKTDSHQCALPAKMDTKKLQKTK